MKPTKSQLNNLNTYDKVATDTFGVDIQFGFRFNYNFRWFWAKSYECFHSKMLKGKKIPLKHAKKLNAVHLN